jgi:hypothetical protein
MTKINGNPRILGVGQVQCHFLRLQNGKYSMSDDSVLVLVGRASAELHVVYDMTIHLFISLEVQEG